MRGRIHTYIYLYYWTCLIRWTIRRVIWCLHKFRYLPLLWVYFLFSFLEGREKNSRNIGIGSIYIIGAWVLFDIYFFFGWHTVSFKYHFLVRRSTSMYKFLVYLINNIILVCIHVWPLLFLGLGIFYSCGIGF